MAAEPFDAGLELPLAGEASLEEIGNRTVQLLREELAAMDKEADVGPVLARSATLRGRWHTLQGFQMGIWTELKSKTLEPTTAESSNGVEAPFKDDTVREQRIKDWMRSLPVHQLLSLRKRLAKRCCEQTSARLIAEVGSTADQTAALGKAADMGPYGPSLCDMVSELYLTSELTALSVIDRLHIYRGAIEELVWLKNLLSIPEKPAGPPTSKGSADIPVPDVGDVTTSRRPSDVTDRDKFLHRANSGGSGVSAAGRAKEQTVSPETLSLLDAIGEMLRLLKRQYRVLAGGLASSRSTSSLTGVKGTGTGPSARQLMLQANAGPSRAAAKTAPVVFLPVSFPSDPTVPSASTTARPPSSPMRREVNLSTEKMHRAPSFPYSRADQLRILPWEGVNGVPETLSQNRSGGHPPLYQQGSIKPSSGNVLRESLNTDDATTTLLPAVWALPDRPPDGLPLTGGGMDILWRWRANRTRVKLLTALGARRVLTCLHCDIDWNVAGLRERFKAEQRRAGSRTLSAHAALPSATQNLIRSSWGAACKRTLSSLTKLKPATTPPVTTGTDLPSGRRRFESDALGLMLLTSRASEITSELSKCGAISSKVTRESESMRSTNYAKLRVDVARTAASSLKLDPEQDTVIDFDFSPSAESFSLPTVTPGRRLPVQQYELEQLCELLCVHRCHVTLLDEGLPACLSLLQAWSNSEEPDKAHAESQLREAMNAIKLSMVAWMEQQGRLIALSGIPYLPRTASLTALAMKRREWKLKMWIGHYMQSMSSEEEAKNWAACKLRLQEANTLVEFCSDHTSLHPFEERVHRSMGAVIPADHGEAAVASHVPGLPTIIQHHSSDGKQNKSSGKLGKLGKNSHRLKLHKAPKFTEVHMIITQLIDMYRSEYKRAKAMLAEDMSSQLRRRAEVSLCRHTGAVKFYESCGPGLVELPPPSDGPAVKDYLLKVTVVEAKNLPRTLAPGEPNPFVKIRCGKYGTSSDAVASTGLVALFNISAQCLVLPSDKLELHVMAKGLSKDELLGQCVYGPVGELLSHGLATELWIPLTDESKSKPSGEFRLKLRLFLPDGSSIPPMKMDTALYRTNYLLGDVPSLSKSARMRLTVASASRALYRKPHSARAAYCLASTHLWLARKLQAGVALGDIMEMGVAKQNLAATELQISLASRHAKGFTKQAWIACGQADAAKALMWEGTDFQSSASRTVRRLQCQTITEALQETRARTVAKFNDMQKTVLKISLKFTARLVKLGSGPVPFKKLFAELSTATFNATPVPQPVVIAPKIKFNVPGSPPVPIASPDLTQALASPSASAGGLLSPKADTGSPLSKYRSAMPTLDELNSLVAPPLVGTSHTGAGNNGSNRSFFRFDTSPPAAGGAKGSPVEALKSGLKESHSLSGTPPPATSGSATPVSSISKLFRLNGSFRSGARIAPEGIPELGSKVDLRNPSELDSKPASEAASLLRPPAFVWPEGDSWVNLPLIDAAVQTLLWGAHTDLLPEGQEEQDYVISKLCARLDRGIACGNRLDMTLCDELDRLPDGFTLPACKASVLRHKSKEKLLIAIAYYTALRRLHVSITKASAPDSSLATLSSVTAHTHAAASVNMGPMATVFEL